MEISGYHNDIACDWVQRGWLWVFVVGSASSLKSGRLCGLLSIYKYKAQKHKFCSKEGSFPNKNLQP